MATELTRYLKKSLDPSAFANPYQANFMIPLYLVERYDFFNGNIFHKKLIFIQEKGSGKSVNTIQKDIAIIEGKLQHPVILVYNSITPYKTRKLIDLGMSFIVIYKYIYLPCISMICEEKRRAHALKDIVRFSPSEQAVFLYMLFNNIIVTTYHIAEYFSFSMMTASRALNLLTRLGLIDYEIKGETGRMKCYSRISDPDYFKKGYHYLINPIRFVYYPRTRQRVVHSLDAGLTALAKLTMLSPPNYEVKAVPPTHQMLIETTPFDEDQTQYKMEMQVWKYDPNKLSMGETVDVVSLMCSLQNEENERIKDELKQLIRSYSWYAE